MTDKTFAERLAVYFDEHDIDSDDDALVIREVATFEDAGMLTMNAGVVLHMSDGSAYQLTIVQSKEATR